MFPLLYHRPVQITCHWFWNYTKRDFSILLIREIQKLILIDYIVVMVWIHAIYLNLNLLAWFLLNRKMKCHPTSTPTWQTAGGPLGSKGYILLKGSLRWHFLRFRAGRSYLPKILEMIWDESSDEIVITTIFWKSSTFLTFRKTYQNQNLGDYLIFQQLFVFSFDGTLRAQEKGWKNNTKTLHIWN